MKLSNYLEIALILKGKKFNRKTWLADQIYVDPITLASCFAKNNFSSEMLIKISKVLDIDISQLNIEVNNDNIIEYPFSLFNLFKKNSGSSVDAIINNLNDNLLISGTPASGKTVITKLMLEKYSKNNQKVLIIDFRGDEYKNIISTLNGFYIEANSDNIVDCEAIDWSKNLIYVGFHSLIGIGEYKKNGHISTFELIKRMKNENIKYLIIDEANDFMIDNLEIIKSIIEQHRIIFISCISYSQELLLNNKNKSLCCSLFPNAFIMRSLFTYPSSISKIYNIPFGLITSLNSAEGFFVQNYGKTKYIRLKKLNMNLLY